MTFDSIRVELYMTEFLTAFFMCVWVPQKRLAYFHVEQYSTDFVLFLCEREKECAVCLNEI